MRLPLVCAVVFAVAAAGRGGSHELSFPVANGDRIAGVYYRLHDAHRFSASCPAGAVLTLRVKAPWLVMEVTGPDGSPIRPPLESDIFLPALTERIACRSSGVYEIALSTGSMQFQLDGYVAYDVAFAWRSRH